MAGEPGWKQPHTAHRSSVVSDFASLVAGREPDPFCAVDAEGDTKSYLIPLQGGAPRPILPGDEGQQSDANWSPDGGKIVLSSSGAGWFSTHPMEKILDLASRQLSTLPGSEETRSPRWSPDGRHIAALFGNNGLKVFDLETQRWSVLREGDTAYPTWSRDGQFIYFLRLEGDPGVYRIQPSGGNAERVVDLKGFRHTGVFTLWMGLDPDDAPLLLRDVGTDDIYALTLEEK